MALVECQSTLVNGVDDNTDRADLRRDPQRSLESIVQQNSAKLSSLIATVQSQSTQQDGREYWIARQPSEDRFRQLV